MALFSSDWVKVVPVEWDKVTPVEERMWTFPPLQPACAVCRQNIKCLAHGFLGKGGFGSVYVGVCLDAEVAKNVGKVALKRCYLKKDQDKRDILREIAVMEKVNTIRNDHLIRLIDHYKDRDATVLVVPKLGREVFEKVCEQKSLSESDAFDIVFQVSSALQALHAHNICHFDVKLENINYRTEDPSCRTICLIDLGLAKESEQWPVIEKSVRGTPLFLPPESMALLTYGPATDVFALGAVLFTALVGKYPYKCNTPHASGDYRVHDMPVTTLVSEPCRQIIARLLDPNPATRITIDAMRDHEWFTNTPGHMECNIMDDNYFSLSRGRTLSRLMSAYPGGTVREGMSPVTPAQWELLRQQFAALRMVDETQFALVMTHIGLERLGTPHVFSLFDLNCSGRVDFREFVHSLIALCGKSDMSYRYIFDIFDSDSNGNIDYQEFRYIFWGVYTEEIRVYAQQVGVHPTLDQINSEQEKALRLEFDSIDRDRNGSVDFNEFTAWYRSVSGKRMLDKTIFSAVHVPS